jgi:hypothetical protein
MHQGSGDLLQCSQINVVNSVRSVANGYSTDCIHVQGRVVLAGERLVESSVSIQIDLTSVVKRVSNGT